MIINLKVTRIIINSSHFSRFYSKFSESNLKKILETMPKEPKHIVEAQKQRLRIKERQQKYVPGKVTVQVLGSGAEGAPKALYMFTDNAKYLFNCGEGTQRLAHEHKMKLSKLEHIFITEPSWRNIGGLPGVSLTIQDVGVPQISLHGPEGLDELFIATRRFVVLRDLKIRMAECDVDTKFEDNVMSVNYVPLERKHQVKVAMGPEEPTGEGNDRIIQVKAEVADAYTSTRSEQKRHRSKSRGRATLSFEDDVDYYAHERKKVRRRSRSRSRSESGTRDRMAPLPPIYQTTREQKTVMCYICRLHPRPGALDVERCVEKRVPPGPLLGQLKAGKDITLDNGSVVRSRDVCFPDDPGPVMLVVDCPSEEYLESLTEEEAFRAHQSSAMRDDDLACLVVHFSPPHIFQMPQYREWIDKFSPSTRHLILNETNTCMGSAAVHRIQYQLNLLSDEIFPILSDKGTRVEVRVDVPCNKKQKLDGDKLKNDAENMIGGLSVSSRPGSPDEGFIQPGTLCKFHLRPKKGLDRESELILDPKRYIEEVMTVEGFATTLQQVKEKIKKTRAEIIINKYPKVLFLGTGSCIPNKTRNVSGILIQTSETCNILLDCGEGTYGQLVRFFGPELSKKILRDLRAVYVSHLHADHHLGLMGVLLGRRKAMKALGLGTEPLLLLAPQQILSWLSFYNRRFQKVDRDYEIIPIGDLISEDRKHTKDEINWMKNTEMARIRTCHVRHCPNAFGVRFYHQDGWSITYSGDTMPCDNLIQLGMNTDLLIHEATMEDDLAHEAIQKMHSTTSQAISAGMQMFAKHILLTHFSQRYAKLPRFSDNLTSGNVSIAFDNMNIKLAELQFVPRLYPSMKLMFADHHEELEHKAVKRQLKAERKLANN